MDKSIGIVVQGDYCLGFTFSVIKKYIAETPGIICLSIWKRTYSLTELRELDCLKDNSRVKVVFSPYPEMSGYQNINFQLQSTKLGIESLDTDFILKTRTDFLVDIKAATRAIYGNLNKIVCVQTNCRFTKPFFVSDFVVGGSKEHVQLYFSAPLRSSIDNRALSSSMLKINSLIEEKDYLGGGSIYNAERYLCTSFLSSRGYYLSNSLSQSLMAWGVIREEMFSYLQPSDIIIDSQKKYTYQKDIKIFRVFHLSKRVTFLVSYIFLKIKFLKSKLALLKNLKG